MATHSGYPLVRRNRTPRTAKTHVLYACE
ncbi:hypothetical protein [Escherichia phage ZCEC13]|uniref:Uncharacterized protein n=1 Tax=Escherichia phage ZCEC13 TaxID=2935866 RepID=A0AAE9HH12_9CAUD|nr:hypothetical protein [Escherichia phage ZCEC13]